MLKNQDLYSEQEKIEQAIEEVENLFQKTLLKVGSLMLKLLHNIRTNQTSMMNKMGADKVKPKLDETRKERE